MSDLRTCHAECDLGPKVDHPGYLQYRCIDVEGRPLGNTQAVAWVLYRDQLLPFEIASLFLLVAMIGAVVLGRRD